MANVIAKNAFFLYLRTIVSLFVTLYTSRVLLEQLGIEDFGIYNLVGGIVAIFAILQSLFSSATQRFLNIEIGKSNKSQEWKILNISISLHILIAIILIVVSEPIGIVLIKDSLNIPIGKESITTIVFHFSVITTAVGFLKVPYNAYVVAHERMSFFAYISIVEVTLKLLVALSLSLFADKLIIYSILQLVTTIIVIIVTYIYCHSRIGLPKFVVYSFKNNTEYKNLLKFSTWIFVGNGASVCRDQGFSILFNMFVGVVINAAMGIVNQISNVYSTLYSNIQTAFMPQITQNSVNNNRNFTKLVYDCSFYSFLLIALVTIPLILNTSYILKLWLGNNVPEYTGLLVKVLMIKVLIVSVSQTLQQTLIAVGRIKEVQIYFALLSILTVIFAYLMLKWGYNPVIVFGLIVLMEIMMMIIRLKVIVKYTAVSLKELWNRIGGLMLVIYIGFVPISTYLSFKYTGFVFLLLSSLVFFLVYALVVYFVILNKEHKAILLSKLQKNVKH